MPKQSQFFNLQVALTNKQELLAAIAAGEKVRVATLNPEFVLEARGNQRFRDALARMTHCTIDGNGLQKLLLSRGIVTERYPGSNLVDDLLRTYAQGEKSFFFLGDTPGVAQKAMETVLARYPGIRILEATDGGRISPDNPLTPELREELTEKRPDIVFVAFGAPKQELWIDAASDLPIQVMVGIGGSLKFYGTKKRAPKLMQTLGLEWLYRALTEKGHLRRVWRAVVVFPIWALFHR